MKQIIVLVLFLLTKTVCAVEVIKIQGELDEFTQEYFWPALSNGGIQIDSLNIYIANGNTIYIQSREEEDISIEILNVHGSNPFTIMELLVTKEDYFLTVLWANGQFYIFKYGRNDNKVTGPVSKHGNCDRMMLMPNGNLICSGAYMPKYVKYLELYDNNSASGMSAESEKNFMQLYIENRAFSITVYDSVLNMIDSVNTLERSGENSYAFQGLYTKHPLDVSRQGNIFLIDNSNGYTIEKNQSPYRSSKNISVYNEAFLRIPDQLSKVEGSKLRRREKSYSVAYALYLKDGYIITSFYGSVTGRDLPTPPYHYDISSENGDPVATGVLDYPIIAEDESEKVFLYVRHEGGWFEDDEIYLVGLTVDDFLTGKAEKSSVDAAIKRFENKQKTE